VLRNAIFVIKSGPRDDVAAGLTKLERELAGTRALSQGRRPNANAGTCV